VSEPAGLVGLLAEPVRLRVVAALALGARTPADVAKASGLGAREIAAALRRLQAAGLVSSTGGELRLHEELIREAARARAPAGPPEDHGVTDPAVAAVLRAFIRDGRLVQIPAAAGKRRVVLEHIAAGFEPGVHYPERQVNEMLTAWYPDYASLRRLLVDERLLERKGGEYWRVGGWVDIDSD
jgi:hypothetical protein